MSTSMSQTVSRSSGTTRLPTPPRLCLGNVQRGELEVEPDVAGIGILLAFIIPSAIALVIGFFLALRPIADTVVPDQYKSNIVFRVIVRAAPARPESRQVSYEHGSYGDFARRLLGLFGSNDTHNNGYHPPVAEELRYQEQRMGRERVSTNSHMTTGHQGRLVPTEPKALIVNSDYITTENQGVRPGYVQVENPYHSERPSSPSIDIAAKKPPTSKPERPPFNEQLYDVLQAALLAITDSQILLSIAFSASYYYNGKCQMTLYHFRLAINIIEIACANAFLSLLLVRDYWKAPVSAVLRVIALLASILLLFSLLQLQNEVGFSAEHMPPMERKDSLVLLRATCFLFKDFASTVFTSGGSNANSAVSGIPGLAITPAEYTAIGPLDTNTKGHHEWPILICLIVNLGLTIVYAVFRLLRRMTPNGIAHGLFFTYSAATWAFCLVVLSFNSTYVFELREWVGRSGWFGNEDENYVGLGQWAALLAMGSIVLSGGDQWRTR